MDSIEVEHPPMAWQRTLSPRLKLLAQALVETTDRAGTGSYPQQRLSHFSHFMRTRSRHEHLGEPLSDMGFIVTIAFKGLGVELAFPISRYFQIFDPSRRCRQITRVRPIAIAFALGTALPPGGSNERI